MVRLVVDGLTNQEIAERLFISVRTVQAHIASATSKTGTVTRTQLAVLALRRGLVSLTGQGGGGPPPGSYREGR